MSNKGLAIIEVNDTGTKGFYIDQDALECALLNAKTKKRVALAERMQREEIKKRRREAKLEAQRREYNVRSIYHIISRCLVSAAVSWATLVGMIHPVVSVPVVMFCLCTACLRLGVWAGRSK